MRYLYHSFVAPGATLVVPRSVAHILVVSRWAGFAILLSFLLLPGCGTSPPPPAIVASAAYVKAPVPGKDLSAAYAKLSNRSDRRICLDGFTASFATRVELHTTQQHADRVRMQRLTQLCIEPGSSTQLAPGGTHFMLFGVADLATNTGELTIELQDAQQNRYPIHFDLRAFNAPTQ